MEEVTEAQQGRKAFLNRLESRLQTMASNSSMSHLPFSEFLVPSFPLDWPQLLLVLVTFQREGEKLKNRLVDRGCSHREPMCKHICILQQQPCTKQSICGEPRV